MTAEVYEWGQDRVLKLYYYNFNQDRVKCDAEIAHAIHESGVSSPALYGIIDVGRRKGIIFERIRGRSMLRCIQSEPWTLNCFARQMAGLQFKMHKCSSEKLPYQKEQLEFAIKQSHKILGNKLKKILYHLENLPAGTSVCHGDLHFDNIIVSDSGLVAIDWSNAYMGNPLGDVARTCLNIISPTVPFGTSNILIVPYLLGKCLTLWSYLNEYMRLAKVRFEDIDAWILPLAAARLKEKIPGEKEWLMDTINKKLLRI